MYFGYLQMSTFGFIGAGFFVVMASMIAFSLVYFIGASRGAAAAARYNAGATLAVLGMAAADVIWALASGQLGRFVGLYGWTPIFEMTVLAMLCTCSLWFMSATYVRSKHEESDERA